MFDLNYENQKYQIKMHFFFAALREIRVRTQDFLAQSQTCQVVEFKF